MKKIIVILIMIASTNLFAQDKIDKLSDKVDRLSDKVDRIAEQQATTNTKIDRLIEQMAETNKQMAVNSADIKGLDKRVDILLYFVGGASGALFLGIIGLIGFIIWDRRAANAPLEIKTTDLKKEVDLLK